MPRVPKGMFKRKGRGWYTRIHAGGKDRWVALGKDLGAAKTKFHQARAAPMIPPKATVAQLSRKWLETYIPTARSAYGQGQAASLVRRFLDVYFGPKLVSKVTADDLREYRLWAESKRLSPASVRHVLGDARCFLNWCEDCGFIARNPFPKRLMPKLQERPPDRLTDEEVRAVSSVPDPYGFVVRLALATGMRWGELTRVTSSDIRDGVLTIHHTKSSKLRRVPLPPELLSELRLRVGKLVPFASSGQFNTRVRILSGVWRFHVHQCRHTFACRWLERGGSLVALQQLLGHSTVVMTQRYARISDELVIAEARRLNSVAMTVATARGEGDEVEAAQEDGGIAKW